MASVLKLEEAGGYLLERGFLENKDFVDGFVSIQEVGGLNRNLCVLRENGPGYFLKQYRGDSARRTRRYAAEAKLYGGVAEEEWLAGLQPFLPRLLLHDREQDLLVLEFIPDPNLGAAEEPDESVTFPDIASPIAEALAACHLAQVPSDAVGTPSGFSTNEKPWALEISRPPPSLLVELSPAQITLLRTIQQHEAVCSRLTELGARWKTTTLIHGDIKWSNMLACAGSSDALGVKIVDWELAKMGDPAWDVGSVFQSYASYSVAATPLEDATPEDAAERFGAAMNQAKPHIRRFWSTYADLAVPERERVSFLERSIQFAGSRLLQTAYEWCQGDSRMSRPVVSILQLGMNLIVNPRQAASVLVDLSDATTVVP